MSFVIEYSDSGPSVVKYKYYMTKYEYTAIIIQRQKELVAGESPKVDASKFVSPIEIAKEELEAGLLTHLAVRREYPNGKIEICKLADMMINNF